MTQCYICHNTQSGSYQCVRCGKHICQPHSVYIINPESDRRQWYSSCTECTRCSICGASGRLTNCGYCSKELCFKHLDMELCCCDACLQLHDRAPCSVCGTETCTGRCDGHEQYWAISCYYCGAIICPNHRITVGEDDYDANVMCPTCCNDPQYGWTQG